MIVAGIGYRSGATTADLEATLALTGGVSPDALASLMASRMVRLRPWPKP